MNKKANVVFIIKPKTERSEKLSISLPAGLVEWIDAMAKVHSSGRSGVIRAAVELAQKSESEATATQ